MARARTGTRSDARRRALEALHAADVSGIGPVVPDIEFARALVEGVQAHRDAIDTVIGDASDHWSIDRMPVLDRNALRLAVFELMHTDTPTGVVVDEAVTLAKLLSTEESGRFVNGILARISREVR
jgi:transcription antitermination protein NusB